MEKSTRENNDPNKGDKQIIIMAGFAIIIIILISAYFALGKLINFI